MLDLKCKVLPPENFIPLNNEQDIAIMAPYFELFDKLYIQINGFNDTDVKNLIDFWDFGVECFYKYPSLRCKFKNTIAAWRYQNEAHLTSFELWYVSQKKFETEIEAINLKYKDIRSKVEALDRVFSTELYKHHSGTIYQLLIVSNTSAANAHYPVSATYMNIETKEIFTRPLKEFEEKFTRII